MAAGGLMIVVAQPATGAWLGHLGQARVLAGGLGCLRLGRAAVRAVAAAGQLALGPVIRHRVRISG